MSDAKNNMQKDECLENEKLNNDSSNSSCCECASDEQNCCETSYQNDCECDCENDDIDELKQELKKATNKCEEYFAMLQRSAAEFDNYKKRTLKERSNLYCDTTAEAVAVFLPVLDNLERAIDSSCEIQENPLKEGLCMVLKQMKDILAGLEVKEIECIGKAFNPEYHNAVMHVEDDSYGENEIIEVLQKGYILKDKVIRHSVVKVAN